MKTQKSPTLGQINRSLRGLKEIEQENTLLPETFAGHFERFVRIYAAVKPLLVMLALVPIFPPTWRKAFDLINEAMAKVTAGADEVSARFKAGRDLSAVNAPAPRRRGRSHGYPTEENQNEKPFKAGRDL